MKTKNLPGRNQQLNRFQTPLAGTWVPTVMDAHFDPYAETPTPACRPASAMESVARITVPSPRG